MSPFALSVLFGALAGLANVGGGLAVVLHGPWDMRRLSGVIAVGAGFMLAAATLRMASRFCSSTFLSCAHKAT